MICLSEKSPFAGENADADQMTHIFFYSYSGHHNNPDADHRHYSVAGRERLLITVCFLPFLSHFIYYKPLV